MTIVFTYDRAEGVFNRASGWLFIAARLQNSLHQTALAVTCSLECAALYGHITAKAVSIGKGLLSIKQLTAGAVYKRLPRLNRTAGKDFCQVTYQRLFSSFAPLR
jgi:hypothetical protein